MGPQVGADNTVRVGKSSNIKIVRGIIRFFIKILMMGIVIIAYKRIRDFNYSSN
jgi:hypothetical protein